MVAWCFVFWAVDGIAKSLKEVQGVGNEGMNRKRRDSTIISEHPSKACSL